MTKPKQVVIESSSRCNLKCRGCYRQLKQMDYPQEDMDVELFESIIDQVAEWNPVIIPFSDGEPLLHFNFLHFLTVISDCDLHYNFATNGTIWNEDVFDFALKTADSICFSLDGLTEHTMIYYRGVRPFYYRIGELLAKKRNSEIAVSLTRNGQDWEEIEEFIRINLVLDGVDYVIIRNHLSSTAYKRRPLSQYPCKYHEGYYLVIRSDGKVRLCERNMNAPIVGDLTKESINAVLPRLTEHEVCKTCGQRYCGSGMFGEIRFKSRPNGQPIYFKQDYFNQIYSLKEVKEGISWQ